MIINGVELECDVLDVATLKTIQKESERVANINNCLLYTSELFSTWDSDGNTFDFHGVTALLDNWIINGKPFREIVEKIM